MAKAQYNRFRRWFILAVSFLMLSIVLYIGKAMAIKHETPQVCVQSAFNVLLSPHGILSAKRKSMHGLQPIVLCAVLPAFRGRTMKSEGIYRLIPRILPTKTG